MTVTVPMAIAQETGAEWTEAFFGSPLQRGNQYKLFSYVVD